VHLAEDHCHYARDVEKHSQSGDIDLVLFEQLDTEPLPIPPLNNTIINWI